MNTIDLHNVSQKQAYAKLSKELLQAKLKKEIGVVVITGRGNHGTKGTDNGVLQKKLPEWLAGVAFKKYISKVEKVPSNPGAYMIWFI